MGKDKCEEDLFELVCDLKWEVKWVDLDKCDDIPKGFRELVVKIGDEFLLSSRNHKDFSKVELSKAKPKINLDLPFFAGIAPTWFVRDNVLYVVFIAGDSPCNLHRIVMWYDFNGSGDPEFHFSITPVCDCEDEVLDTTVLYMRSGGRGGGIGH